MTRVTFKPSPEQRKVIDHRGGHLQVVACAGAVGQEGCQGASRTGWDDPFVLFKRQFPKTV